MSGLATVPDYHKRNFLIALCATVIVGLCLYMLFHHNQSPFEHAVGLIKEGKAAAAIPILEEISRQHPDNTAVFPWLAQGYLITDRFAEGRTALDTALKLKVSPTVIVPVVMEYARQYESKNDFLEAERLFYSAQSACSAKALANGRAQLYLNWADHVSSNGDLYDAVKHLELAARYCPDIDEPLKGSVLHQLSDTYRQMAAIAEIKNQQDDEAVKLLEKSLSVSDEPATRMALAQIFARQGKTDDAINAYKMVCTADQNNLEARHQLVELLLEQKNYEAAQEALMELTDKEHSLENYHLLAALNLKMGNYGGAVHALEEMINLRQKDPALLTELEKVLSDWTAALIKEGKSDEAMSVKGHAERVKEMLDQLVAKEPSAGNAADKDKQIPWNPANPPIALSSSRIWLAKGSLTPEGEITISNITGSKVNDLALTVIFYDNTSKTRKGTVILPVTVPTAAPFEADRTRSLYFSSPNIVKADHQLSVRIYWKGRFLKELPVVKMN